MAEAQAIGPGMMHDRWSGWIPFGGLLWLILVGAVVGGLVLLLRSRGGSQASTPRRSAVEILDERYARGDIDREEYLRRKDDIS